MSETLTCPSCGTKNPSGRDSCESCNFPLHDAPPPRAEAAAAPAPSPAPAPPANISEGTTEPPLIRRPLRRRRRDPGQQQAMTLWLVFGTLAAAVVLFVAIQANVKRITEPIEGSSAQQQKRADELLEILSRDSTNVQAHQALADIFYDTGNWPQAIVHYQAAVARDSGLVGALVDLGVCYYNLDDSGEAERHFMLALARDPHHPIALFNLGIVNERRERYDAALQYFHRAIESGPPENMQPSLMEAIERVLKKTGRTAPPLPTPGGR